MDLLRYAFFLRVPIVAAAALFLLPFFAFYRVPALLKGMFDLSPKGFFYSTASALAASWTVMVSAWAIVNCAWVRYPQLTRSEFHLTWRGAAAFATLALPAVMGAWSLSRRQQVSATRLFLSGVAAIMVMSLLAYASYRTSSALAQRVPSLPGLGYEGHSQFHFGAGVACILFFIVYAGFGVWNYKNIGESTLPALACLLLLFALLDWVFSGMTFFLDYYSIPLAVPLALLAVATAHSRRSDHFYRVESGPAPALPNIADVLLAGNNQCAILVAANGGGIQAAAWAAQVLTGIEEDSLLMSKGCRFSHLVRFITSVSGGTVGAMYFVDACSPKGALNLEEVRASAEDSSLDEVAWGLIYPDLIRSIVPWIMPRSIPGRGEALERSWEKNNGLGSKTFSSWVGGVLKGWRPAVLFNATFTENGYRYLLGTAAVSSGIRRSENARVSFSDLYVHHDIRIATAARLSSSFPWVSPAARADINDDTPQPHAVDGGYYDNYGMATLVECLDEALARTSAKVKNILCIEIHDSPIRAPGSRPKSSSRGWFFQFFAPLLTMLNVREAGQVAHNEIELELLRQKWALCGVNIETEVFEFPKGETSPPLSWHLTQEQKDAIHTAWDSDAIQDRRRAVINFMDKNHCGKENYTQT